PPTRLAFAPVFPPNFWGAGHGPRWVNPPAPRRKDAPPPIAQLVTNALDDDGGRVGNGPGGRLLIAQVLQEIFGGSVIEIVFACQSIECRRGRNPQHVVHQAPDGESELERPPRPVA